jgi:hypothetical protein
MPKPVMRTGLVIGVILILFTSSIIAQTARVSLTGPDAMQAGEEITISVRIDGVRNLGAYQFTLVYDTAHLEYVGIEMGPFLPEGGRQAQALPPRLEPGAGRVTFAVFSLGGGAGADGDGVLAYATFRLLQDSGSEVSLENLQLVQPDANSIQASEVTPLRISGVNGQRGGVGPMEGDFAWPLIAGAVTVVAGILFYLVRVRRLWPAR